MPRKPKYCHHKGKDLAYVRIDGKPVYLGKYNSPESRDAYDAEILKWRRTHDLQVKHQTTVAQLAVEFLKHAAQFYRDEHGQPTGEASNFRKALRVLVEMYRSVPCSQFGPLKLQNLQARFVKSHVRTQVNKNVSRVKQVFRWGVANELVPAEVVLALDCVRGLQKGRSNAQEADPVEPVPQEDFDGAIEKMSDSVRAMCQLLLLTGARVSEIRLMRIGDLDTSGEVWLYRPGAHKNAWRGKDRTIFIGPKAQEILMPFVADAVQADLFVFRPREENEPYSLRGMESSIRKACKRAEVNHWSPGRLRHNTATNVNRAFGDIDASRVVLGHSERNTTAIYAERDLQKAAEIAQQIG